MITKKVEKENPAGKVVGGPARASYAHVFKPTSVSKDKPDTLKYSVALMIPKSNKALYAELKKAQEDSIQWGIDNIKEWGGKKPNNMRLALKNGDVDFDLDKNPEYAGHWVVSARSDRKPVIINLEKEPLTTDDEFYSGCWTRFSIKFFAYGKIGKGVSVQLNHLQKVKDAKRFGTQVASADEDFSDDWDDDGSIPEDDDSGLMD